MRQRTLVSGVLAASAVMAGCSGDLLDVTNVNNPDVDRVLATPADVEGLIGGLGIQLNNTKRLNESINTQAKILAGEGFATVANFGMNIRAEIPRLPLDNSLGNAVGAGNNNNFNTFSRISRNAANGILALDRLAENNQTIGSPAQDARARAFAFLILGEALGNLSLGYDSAAVVTPAVPSSEVPTLSHYSEVNAAALAMLDSAIATATSPAAGQGANGFPLPNTWISGQANLTADRFVQYARSLKARIRAGVARTPDERQAVDWNAVIADATNGVSADFQIDIGGSLGWTAQYDRGQMYVTGGWHTMSMMYYGMADTSGGYDNWLSTPFDTRRAFLVRTPDTRWPQGNDRAAQQADAGPTVVLREGAYVRNRPTGEDVPIQGYGDSFYDHSRYGAGWLATVGPYVEISATEMSMLAAEGYIRTSRVPEAIALINASRTRNGLPAIPTNTGANSPIGTLPNCVPRVPAPPSFTSTQCGSVLEAMKYEKRMETAYTGYLIWFADNRGWGDLVENTPLEWATPFQELQARLLPIYSPSRTSARGTYGF